MGGARQSRGAHGVVFRKAIDLDESGNRYGAILNDIVEKLQAAGTDRERCNAVKDIVLEYLHNMGLHRPDPEKPSPLPVIEIKDIGVAITVTMEGTARKDDMQRMEWIVKELSERSNEALWKELKQRSFSDTSKPFETPSAGLGLLTVAALSSRARLQLKLDNRQGAYHFSLTSSV